jgi:hypothetical protein
VYKLLNPKLPSSEVYRLALLYQIRKAQKADFSLDEILDIVSKKKKSSNLTPFIDKSGTIRSHSRLSQIRNVPFDTWFSVILSSRSFFSKLLIAHYHYQYEHTVSVEAAKAKIKNMLHIVGLENGLKSIRSVCLFGKKNRAKASTQIMASLPSYRFETP